MSLLLRGSTEYIYDRHHIKRKLGTHQRFRNKELAKRGPQEEEKNAENEYSSTDCGAVKAEIRKQLK